MKADTFIKVVLSVIAIDLTIIAVRNIDIIPEAIAGSPATRTEILSGVTYGLVPVNDDGTINVRLNSDDELDVNIVGIETNDELNMSLVEIETDDELDVNLDEIGGGYVSYGGPILVKID